MEICVSMMLSDLSCSVSRCLSYPLSLYQITDKELGTYNDQNNNLTTMVKFKKKIMMINASISVILRSNVGENFWLGNWNFLEIMSTNCLAMQLQLLQDKSIAQ